jgi:hypothetical protein
MLEESGNELSKWNGYAIILGTMIHILLSACRHNQGEEDEVCFF